MKKVIKPLIAALAVVIFTSSSFAQSHEQPAIPKWVPEKGYWVLETNIHAPLEHTVLFYNDENTLIYKETVNGTRLNLKRASVKMKLKKALEAALIAWEKNKTVEENKAYLSALR